MELDARLEAEGVDGYRQALQPISSKSPECAQYVSDAVSQMREALLRELLRDPVYFRRWEELRCKAQTCWGWRPLPPPSSSDPDSDPELPQPSAPLASWVMASPASGIQHPRSQKRARQHDRFWAQLQAQPVVAHGVTWRLASDVEPKRAVPDPMPE